MSWLAEERDASTSRACKLLGLARSTYYHTPRPRAARPLDEELRQVVLDVAKERPSFGYRRVTAMARRRLGKPVNEKAVRRVMKREGLMLGRTGAPPPRTRLKKRPGKQITSAPDVAWQLDLKYIDCGRDGWAYLQNVVDCCTSEWLGYVFDPFCGADEAIRLISGIVPDRFPESGLAPRTVLRVDNGPCYRARRFVEHTQGLGFVVEHIHYRTLEENGVVESLHSGLERDYLGLTYFDSFEEARAYIHDAWWDYNEVKPQQRLEWRTPREYYQEVKAVAN